MGTNLDLTSLLQRQEGKTEASVNAQSPEDNWGRGRWNTAVTHSTHLGSQKVSSFRVRKINEEVNPSQVEVRHGNFHMNSTDAFWELHCITIEEPHDSEVPNETVVQHKNQSIFCDMCCVCKDVTRQLSNAG